MDITNKLNYLKETKVLLTQAVAQAATNAGIGEEVLESTPISELATIITSLPTPNRPDVREYVKWVKNAGGFTLNNCKSGHLMKVEWKFRNNKSTSSSGHTLVGHPNQFNMYSCRVQATKNIALYRRYTGTNWTSYSNLTLSTISNMTTDIWYTMTLSGIDGTLNMHVDYDDGTAYDKVQTTFTTSTHGYPDDDNMLIFEPNRTSSISSIDVDIAYIKIWQDGVNLTCELYPAVDDNGIGCMWDKVSNTLYYFGTPSNFEMSEVRI